jgi:hypothetical protein
MAEKIKDAEDRLLELLLAAEPIEDAGFSDRVMGRIRRRVWLRRLALPVAILLGGVFAVRSLLQLGPVLTRISEGISIDLPASMLTQLPIVFGVCCLIMFGIVTFQLSEE